MAVYPSRVSTYSMKATSSGSFLSTSRISPGLLMLRESGSQNAVSPTSSRRAHALSRRRTVAH